jgi:tyrosyl-tRNA synthetase
MTFTEELIWRGFFHQTTYPDGGQNALNGSPLIFYWGVDPTADSMTVGNLAVAMLVRHFISHGHKAVLLVGGATGLIGDPDGKSRERELLSSEEVSVNKQRLVEQYRQLFTNLPFEIVDNYDWFKDIHFLDFLRDIGKHVPLSQMLGREFVNTRLKEEGGGLSYAEFSYILIQAYDFLKLYQDKGVRLQLCGSDQWGNSIAGVDLIRRIAGGEAHVYAAPLVVNSVTGQKFGKTETGAIWLDAAKTSPTQFYQFWINQPDEAVEGYLKIFTFMDKLMIEELMAKQQRDPGARPAQTALAAAVTDIVHGQQKTAAAVAVTDVLVGNKAVGDLDGTVLQELRSEIPVVSRSIGSELAEVLTAGGLATSKTDARQLISNNAISLNGQKTSREHLQADDFQTGRLLIRRGKAYRDTMLVELT